MSDDEIQKMLIELRDKRKSNRSKTLTSVRPTGSASITNISGGAIGMDFASLYPSTMKVHFPSRQSRRKNKIKKIFDL
jgi:hypothetical protein